MSLAAPSPEPAIDDPFIVWCLIVGALLILIGLSDTWRKSMPVSTSALYLAVGYLLGPEALNLLRITLLGDAVLLERLTEVAVVVSLFAVGLRLHALFRDPLWLTPVLLATLGMVLTIAMMAGIGLALGLSVAAATLLGAVLAPTDPVLASDVQVDDADDRDRLRFSLTGEGGLNDGTAFPFVMLALGLAGLHELGPWGVDWWTVDVLWATTAGLGLGWLMGFAFSRLVVWLRREQAQALGMESFLTLGLIAATYGLALAVSAYGFLAVFMTGVAMRHVERTTGGGATAASDEAGARSAGADSEPAKSPAYMAKVALDFALDLEKLAELTVMLIIGSLLTRQAFTPTSLAVALALIFVVRPAVVYLTTWRSSLNRQQRRLLAWFGIRGIGSMYYLAYAASHGAFSETSRVQDAVLVTIALSVLLHGCTSTPFMHLYRRAGQRRSRGD